MRNAAPNERGRRVSCQVEKGRAPSNERSDLRTSKSHPGAGLGEDCN